MLEGRKGTLFKSRRGTFLEKTKVPGNQNQAIFQNSKWGLIFLGSKLGMLLASKATCSITPRKQRGNIASELRRYVPKSC